MPAETTAKREAGVDLARAFALLLLVMPVSVALNLVPENRLHWLGSVPPAANTLLAALLGISAYLYARRVTFPQFFASTVVRAIAFFVLGWLLAQGRAYQPVAAHAEFPILYDLLIPFAVLTLLTTLFVYSPLWVQAALTALASPAIPFTYEQLVNRGWAADDWLSRTIPALFNEYTGTVLHSGLKMLWQVGLGILLWRAYEKLGPKIGVPVGLLGLGAAALFWVNPKAQSGVLAWPTTLSIVGVAGVLYVCAEAARVLAGRGAILEPFARVGRMSLSASIVILLAAVHGGIYLVQLVAGAEYRAPLEGTWLTYLYWVGFLALAWGVGALFTWLWQKLLSNSTISRGPLECVLALMSGRG